MSKHTTVKIMLQSRYLNLYNRTGFYHRFVVTDKSFVNNEVNLIGSRKSVNEILRVTEIIQTYDGGLVLREEKLS